MRLSGIWAVSDEPFFFIQEMEERERLEKIAWESLYPRNYPT